MTVLIPARNEEERVAETVQACLGLPGVNRVLVVDDGSRDATATRAREAGADVLQLPAGRGKGGALNAAAPLVRDDVVVLADADLGASATQLERLLAPVRSGEADLAVARFRRGGGGGLGMVKALAGYGIRRLTGFRMVAPLSGQRAMRWPVWQDVLPLAPGFGVEVAMTVRALRRGYLVREVEVEMAHRATGRDWRGFYHRGRQCWHVMGALLREVGWR